MTGLLQCSPSFWEKIFFVTHFPHYWLFAPPWKYGRLVYAHLCYEFLSQVFSHFHYLLLHQIIFTNIRIHLWAQLLMHSSKWINFSYPRITEKNSTRFRVLMLNKKFDQHLCVCVCCRMLLYFECLQCTKTYCDLSICYTCRITIHWFWLRRIFLIYFS